MLPIRLFLLSLSCSITFAIPFDGIHDAATNLTGLIRREDPKEATFFIDDWEDISEQDCYILLCLKGCNRVL